MPKKKWEKIMPDTEGSVYAAWCPMFGQFDIRWAAQYEPKPTHRSRYDTDLDIQLDIDKQYYFV